MKYQNVLTEMDGDLLIVTLHWPERQNAMNHQMRVDLMACVQGAETDDAVKAIVLTGAGEKAFCAGANIPELEQRTLASELGPSATLRKDLPTTIERLGKPTVAAINGYCFGAGLELAMGCTVRVASDNAVLAQPEITLGQIPGSGGTQRLYRFVGLGWAMQMVLTGQRIDAKTASSIGLVTEVMAPADLLPRAKELARLLGAQAPIAFAAGRDAVLRSTETDLLTGIDYERKLYALCMATEDNREGLDAYAEKRPPKYKGR
jgi:enoyl-CoA hydratase